MQGTEEQKARWLQKALDFEIIGTFAQTEIGHGMEISFSLHENVVHRD
jgi:alkylation response protein AidB-like acyl-CoA dehydrogenase